MTTITGDALRGHLELLVLSALNDAPAHGYLITKHLQDRSDGAFEIAEGSLYPALHRMETAGAIKSKWKQGGRGPRRRVYSLTAQGRRNLKTSLAEWEALVAAMDSVVPE